MPFPYLNNVMASPEMETLRSIFDNEARQTQPSPWLSSVYDAPMYAASDYVNSTAWEPTVANPYTPKVDLGPELAAQTERWLADRKKQSDTYGMDRPDGTRNENFVSPQSQTAPLAQVESQLKTLSSSGGSPMRQGAWGPGNYGYIPITGIKYQGYLPIINKLIEAQRTGNAVQIGNYVYDPSKDVERWWHVNPEDRFNRGESSGSRIIRYLIEAAQGKRDHIAQLENIPGYVDPNDPVASFGKIVERWWKAVDNRQKVPAERRNRSYYGFWVKQ
jgi:hypothetical protein